MRRIRTLRAIVAVLSLQTYLFVATTTQADEKLFNGNLEQSPGPPGWNLSTFVTGMPATTIPSVFEHNDGANNPPTLGLGIVLHPQAGNTGTYAGQDKGANFVLDQTFTGIVVGRTYTFKGDVLIQDGYSGIVNTLNPLYPSGDYNQNLTVDYADYPVWRDNFGSDTNLPTDTTDGVLDDDYTRWKTNYGNVGRSAIPSPTTSTFEISFLNASDVIVGTPTVFDLKSDPTVLAWRNNSVMAVAPAGATKVRVKVSALDMRDNCCEHGQDVQFDNFSLRDNGQFSSGIERLTNADLNIPGEPPGWTVVEGPTVPEQMKTADSAAFIDFANRLSNVPNPNPTPGHFLLPTGAQGLWLRPYVNTTQFDPDILDDFATMSQEVNGTPGANYAFSAWSAWESGYCGGLPGSTTQTFMKIEFLNGAAVIGTSMLDLKAAGQMNDDDSGANVNGGNVEFDDWRQFSLNAVAPATTTKVRVSLGGTGMFNSSIDPQSAFFDEMSLIETLPGAGAGSAVPEPGAVVLVGIALVMISGGRRKR